MENIKWIDVKDFLPGRKRGIITARGTFYTEIDEKYGHTQLYFHFFGVFEIGAWVYEDTDLNSLYTFIYDCLITKIEFVCCGGKNKKCGDNDFINWDEEKNDKYEKVKELLEESLSDEDALYLRDIDKWAYLEIYEE